MVIGKIMSVDLEKYAACLFTLEYCGKSRRLKEFQLTTYWIGKSFNIFPDSIVLVGSDGTTEVPDETGQFTLLSQYLEYEVQGDSSTTEGNVEPAVSSYAFPYSTYKPYAGKKAIVKQTGYKHKGPVSKPPGVVSQETVESGSKLPKKEEWKKNVEICAYTEHGRLKKISNFPMTLTNDTAKVDFIAESISQELFDGTVVFLIDVDNLKIRDSTVTRG